VSELPTGTVTFLFTDLEGSSRLWEEYPEAMKGALARHDVILRDAVGDHGGQVVKTTGDGVHAVFGRAEDAVAAAVEAQRAVDAERWPEPGRLRVRMGLHTGTAESRDGDYFGPALNRAARLTALAHGGQALVSQATEAVVRDALAGGVELEDLGEHRLRDLSRPERVFQLVHPDLPREFPPLRSLVAVPGNLPVQVTSFVGREGELERVAYELENGAIITLTGVGGVGKTRLALEVAVAVLPNFRDGGWLCELAGVRDAEAVPDAVVDVFGLDPRPGMTATDSVLNFLRAKQLLLVLDNCEHLLKPVARLVSEIAHHCPGVRVLATSREGLGLAGERILVVASLNIPDSAEEFESVAVSDAVRLFVDRAVAVRAGFALDTANAGAVAQICERLDGVPLAIELAAARVGMLTPSELAQRLDERFRILTGSERGAVERHQTLQAAIDWSYDLLDDGERTVLDRLSVFAGGFTLAAAEAVASGERVNSDAVFELLAGLVARSLVEADTEGTEARYRLLETIRQYAQERLDGGGDTDRVRGEHARYFAAFGEAALAGVTSPAELEWWQRFSREIDNVRVALTWAIERRDVDTTLRLVVLDDPRMVLSSRELGGVLHPAAEAALAIPGIADDPRYPTVLLCAAMHCHDLGDLEGVTRYCDDALAAEARLGVDPSPRVWGTRSWVAMTEGQVDDYVEYAERGLAICRGRDEPAPLATALTAAAMAHALKGDDTEVAIADIDEALTLAQKLAIPTLLGSTRAFAAFVLADVRPDRALVLMREALQYNEAQRVRNMPVHSVLGDVAERLGDRRQALEFFVIGMDELHWLGNTEMVGRMLRRIGIRLVEHDPEAAALVIGAGTAFSHGWTLTERVVEDQGRGIEALNTALGADRRAELMAQGAAMEEHNAVIGARAAAARVLATDDGLHEPRPNAALPGDNAFRART
jgi:predicted ATPase/class 3 adenylate cyclase